MKNKYEIPNMEISMFGLDNDIICKSSEFGWKDEGDEGDNWTS